MHEIANDPFYGLLKLYDDCVIDYCLLQCDTPYQGEESHRRALELSIQILQAREADYYELKYDIDQAKAIRIEAETLLYAPRLLRRDYYGNAFYDCEWECQNTGDKIPYWYAFLEPPHGASFGYVKNHRYIKKRDYEPEDFQKLNQVLFPNGSDTLEVYEWSTDWTNYFDDGHEWWGASCWTVYDTSLNRFVVIMASATD